LVILFIFSIKIKLSSYQLENQPDVKKYDFKNTLNTKKDNTINTNKKNITTFTIINNNENTMKRNVIKDEISVFPKIKNKQNFHNRNYSHK